MSPTLNPLRISSHAALMAEQNAARITWSTTRITWARLSKISVRWTPSSCTNPSEKPTSCVGDRGELLAPPLIPSTLQKTRRSQDLNRAQNSLCRKLHRDPHPQHQRGWVPRLPNPSDIDTTGSCILRTAAEEAGTVAGMPSSKSCGFWNVPQRTR